MNDRAWKTASIVAGALIFVIACGGFIAKPLDLATCEARGGVVFTSADCESV